MAMAEVLFDKAEQVQIVQGLLIPGEALEGVFEVKTVSNSFIAITSRRIIFHDAIRKTHPVMSLPYRSITAVASDQGPGKLRSSALHVIAGTHEYTFELWQNERAHTAHTLILAHLI
jgi:hypothetical protein